MTICKVCLEEYEEENVRCPFCGCPADWMPADTFSEYFGFEDRYRLIQARGWSDPFPDGLYWDEELQQTVQIRKLPPTQGGTACTEFIRALDGTEDWHPRLYEFREPDSQPGYYICGAAEGKTLQRLLEEENPLKPAVADRIEAGLGALLQKTEEIGVPAGIFLPEHLQITDEGAAFADLGPGNPEKSDGQQAEELVFRIRSGFWPWEEAPPKSGMLRKISGKIFSYVRRNGK